MLGTLSICCNFNAIILLIGIQSAIPQWKIEVRDLLKKGAEEKSATETGIQLALRQCKGSDSTIAMAYHAAFLTQMAKHLDYPNEKLKYFNQGKKQLEKCIAAEPKNPELIYLRYTIQTNVPAILGYKSKLKDDKEILISSLEKKNLIKEDEDLFKRIFIYLSVYGNLNENEKKRLSN